MGLLHIICMCFESTNQMVQLSDYYADLMYPVCMNQSYFMVNKSTKIFPPI